MSRRVGFLAWRMTSCITIRLLVSGNAGRFTSKLNHKRVLKAMGYYSKNGLKNLLVRTSNIIFFIKKIKYLLNLPH